MKNKMSLTRYRFYICESLILTDIGGSIYSHNIIDIPSNRLKDILKAIPHLCNSIAKCDINEVFYKLNIEL